MVLHFRNNCSYLCYAYYGGNVSIATCGRLQLNRNITILFGHVAVSWIVPVTYFLQCLILLWQETSAL